MKKHMSVLMLAFHATVYKALGVLVLMGGVQALLFWMTFRATGDTGFETLLAQSRVSWACGAGFLLYVFILCLGGLERSGAKPGYTLKRLSVDEKTVVLWWALANCIFLLIFWAAQLGIVLLLFRLYEALAGAGGSGGQALFLAFYRSPFLHSLLPLDESSRYARNLLFLTGLGVSAACFSWRQRRGQWGLALLILAAAALAFFPRELGRSGSDGILSVMALATGGMAVYRLWEEQGDEA